MKKFTVLLLFLAIFIFTANAQVVNVTFRCNTSTVDGFTDSTHTLQVRGGIHRTDDSWSDVVLLWNDGSAEFTNVGGDYWDATVAFPDSFVADTIEWKVGATIQTESGTDDFWENNDNRKFVIPATDDTTDLAFVSHGYDPPYTPSDSVDIYFKLNMGVNESFSPANTLSLVGHFPAPDGAANMWNPGAYTLSRLGDTDYWTFHLKLAQGYIDTVENIKFDAGWPESAHGMHMYRFAIGNDWNNSENLGGKYFDGNENRVIYLKNTTNDTTLAWKYWNDVPPATGPQGTDSVQVKFTGDLTRAINENGFAIGDTLYVQYGFNSTATLATDTLVNVFGTNQYAITVNVKNVQLGENVEYAYFAIKNGQPVRDKFYDFTDPETGSQQNRKILIPLGTTTEVVEANDIVESNTDIHRVPTFKNTSPIGKNVLVTYTCDIRPPYYQVKLEGDTILNTQGESWQIYPGQEDSVFAWGVYINGPGNGQEGWQDWSPTSATGLAEHKMFDDGTHGDMTAGDSIYAIQVLFSPDSSDIVGQEFKFGLGGGDNEAGSGAGYGLNHFENIDDSQDEYTIHSDFGSINPPFYSRWDFDGHYVTDIRFADDVTVTRSPRLHRNYPNPFNPVTTISFELQKQMDVKLIVYNAVGQKVRTLLNGKQNSGGHKVLWNGTNDHGQIVSSGIYFYRLKTENYDKVMKMVLLK